LCIVEILSDEYAREIQQCLLDEFEALLACEPLKNDTHTANSTHSFNDYR
jgi:hypothetical protein